MYVGKGYADNAMFKLNVTVAKNSMNKTTTSIYMLEFSNSCVWHGRLGHVNFNSVPRLINLNSIPKFKINSKSKKVVRSYRGGEYVSPFAELCAQSGIIHERTPPYSPKSNGVAERKNRTLKEMMNAMLISSGVRYDLWGEAILSANYVLNMIPRKKISETPYELWMGKKPSYKYLKVWGYLAKLTVPSPKALTIGPKTVDCIFIGYAHHSNVHRFIVHESKNPNVHEGTIVEWRTADFFENVFPCLRQTHPTSLKSVDEASTSRAFDDMVHDRHEQPEENEGELRGCKRPRIEKSFGSDFMSYMVEETPGGYVILYLYVDDMLIIGSNDNIIRSTKDMLKARFDMKDLGLADVILGVQITRNQNGLVLSQSHYVEKILEKFNKDDTRVASTPIDTTHHLFKNRGEGLLNVSTQE
ncbi:uncharacterized protein LOC143573594 [Bidens hawaiensis]|uniref:uncharacterized protein LOC143573594 n=1 Tax=Bidens hawaiensis TaxID=980011 RepID=UPI00404AA661